jgi:apolipoprotein N-acyltransferase
MLTIDRMTKAKIMHQAATTAAGPRAASFVKLFTLASISGMLLWACYYPLNCGWLAWFALVPMLMLAKAEAKGRTIYLSALAGGMLFAVLALKWMRVADPMMVFAWIALAFYVALYFPLAIWVLRKLDRLRLPLALTVPVVWVSLEYLRAHFLGGFAWYFLGYTQQQFLPVIQIADLGGVFAVSIVVAAVNGVIVDLLSRFTRLRLTMGPNSLWPSGKSVAIAAVITLLLFGGDIAYGLWRLGQNDFPTGPRVAMLQTNIPQQIKNDRSGDDDNGKSAREWMMHQTWDLVQQVRASKNNPDLIVWPETTYPFEWLDIVPGTPVNELPAGFSEDCKACRNECRYVAIKCDSSVLLGMNTERCGPGLSGDRFNSAVLVGKNGENERYDKIHCVPFGEYLPMRQTCPWMKHFSPYPFEYSLTPGESQSRLKLHTEKGDYRFGVLICYEDSDATLARHYATTTEDGPPADFLVNISNDGWFNGTEEHEVHMAVCRFRAVETRRAVVRSVNMGISGVFDGNGRVIALPAATWSESKKIATTIVADVPLDRRRSIYAMAGDWLAVICAASCVGLMMVARKRA